MTFKNRSQYLGESGRILCAYFSGGKTIKIEKVEKVEERRDD